METKTIYLFGWDLKWFLQCKAYAKRGYTLADIAKQFRCGKIRLCVQYGQDTKWYFPGNLDAVGYLTIRMTLDATEHNCYVIERRIGRNWVEISEENMCFLLGFYTIPLDNEGNVEYDDNGNMVIDWSYYSYLQWQKQMMASYKEFTLLTFLICSEQELADKLNFVY